MEPSLQRSGPGLWFSSCGRFAIRRLPNKSWAISAIGAHSRVGGFTKEMSSRLITQRFRSLSEAREAISLLLDLESPADAPTPCPWTRREDAWVYRCPQGMDVSISPEGSFWKITATPAALSELDENSLAAEFILDRSRCFLGRARSLSQAKQIVGQELSRPWPQGSGLF